MAPKSTAVTPFAGIPPEGLAFLTALEANNEKAWFHANHDWYRLSLREPMLALGAALLPRVERMAPDYGTEPRRAITSINRDRRFLRDRVKPYKSWLALAFRRPDATLGASASFYVSVSPQDVRIRCGLTLPIPSAVRALRAHLLTEFDELRRVMRRKGLRASFGEVQGERLRRVPKDVPEDHPALDLLLYRSLYVEAELPPETSATAELVNRVAHHFRMAVPLVELVDAALLGDL